jgi:secreted trypsin-like serine protease
MYVAMKTESRSRLLRAGLARLARLAAFALVALPLGGCVVSTEEELTDEDVEVGVAESEIIGGSVDKGDKSVVSVLVWNQQVSRTCTGTVVSPRVVLTAAHCVAAGDVGSNNVVQIFVGNNTGAAWPWLYKSVAAVHVHPKYVTGNLLAGNDIAVVVAKKALGLPALPMNRVALTADDIDEPVRFVGYGKTDAGDPDSVGKKHQTTLELDSISSTLLTTSSAKSFTCSGDSGGPGLMKRNGVEYVAGVVSFGGAKCSTTNSSVRVDVYAKSFVDPYIAKYDPGFKIP